MPLSGRGAARAARPKVKYPAAAVRSSGGLSRRCSGSDDKAQDGEPDGYGGGSQPANQQFRGLRREACQGRDGSAEDNRRAAQECQLSQASVESIGRQSKVETHETLLSGRDNLSIS